MALEETYSLSDFLGAISGVIAETFEGKFWITAELSSAHAKSKGYWVLELQEVDDAGQKLAQTQALVWANAVPRVIYRFEKTTKQKLSQGMKVRLLVSASFHPQWGFRLTCDDIDPNWTLGEAEANNKRIQEKLEKEGVWSNQKKLILPKDFYHVGVVAPDTSAGLEDFLKEADVLSSFNLTSFVVEQAPFEGQNAKTGIPNAIEKLVSLYPHLDAICVVRGGGASSGIATLNDEQIVRSICLCPIPVISGIGHERDNTLVDDVANTKCGTPSKTIAFITQSIVQQAQQARQHMNEVEQIVQQRVSLMRQSLSEQYLSLEHTSVSLVKQARQEIGSLFQQSLQLGPKQTLARGYALVKDTQSNRLVKSKDQALHLKHLTIVFDDGEVDTTLSTNSKEKED